MRVDEAFKSGLRLSGLDPRSASPPLAMQRCPTSSPDAEGRGRGISLLAMTDDVRVG
jgi:hypothetical protein